MIARIFVNYKTSEIFCEIKLSFLRIRQVVFICFPIECCLRNCISSVCRHVARRWPLPTHDADVGRMEKERILLLIASESTREGEKEGKEEGLLAPSSRPAWSAT